MVYVCVLIWVACCVFIWQLPAEAFPDFKEPMNCHLTHGLLGPTAGDVHLVYFHPECVLMTF